MTRKIYHWRVEGSPYVHGEGVLPDRLVDSSTLIESADEGAAALEAIAYETRGERDVILALADRILRS